MRFNDLVRVSLRQVVRHRRRYIGVVLAIAVGVAGFISIITMGQDVKRNFNEDLTFIGGVTIIRIVLEPRPQLPLAEFHKDTVQAVRDIPGVSVASLVGLTRLNFFWKGEPDNLSVVAVDENFWKMRNLSAITGTLFPPEAVEQRQRVVVLGKRLAESLFGTLQVAGRTIELGNDIYRVTGIVGGLRDINMEKSVFLPLTTAVDRFSRELVRDRMYVRCATWDDVPLVAKAIPQAVSGPPGCQDPGGGSWLGKPGTRQKGGLLDRIFHLSGLCRHVDIGRHGYLEHHDGRGAHPHPGNRPQKGHGRGGPGHFVPVPHRGPLPVPGGGRHRRGHGKDPGGTAGPVDRHASPGRALFHMPGYQPGLRGGLRGRCRPLPVAPGSPHGGGVSYPL